MKRPFTLDLRSLALLRMALGGLVVLDVLLRLRDLTVFYTDAGVLPRSVLFRQTWLNPSYNLLLSSGTTEGMLVLFLLVALAGGCLAVGWHSRLAGLATWYLVSCVQLRNPLLLDGGDDLLRLMLFWTAFLPMGARWSLEARKEGPDTFVSIATFGYVLQVCLLYFFAALLKSDPVWRVSGDALYYTLSIDQFTTGLAHWLVLHPDWMRPLTFAALSVEFCIPVLLLVPWRTDWCRTLALIMAWGLHLSMALLLHLGLFMPIVCLSLLGLIPSRWYGRPEPTQPPGTERPGWLVYSFLVLVCVYMVGMNVRSLQPVPAKQNRLLAWFGALTHEGQSWRLFAPYPFRDDGWFWLEGTRRDGQTVTLLGGPEKPAFVSAQFRNQRWRRWLQNLREGFPDLRASYLAMVARENELVSVRLIYCEEYTNPPGEPPTLTRRVLATRP